MHALSVSRRFEYPETGKALILTSFAFRWFSSHSGISNVFCHKALREKYAKYIMWHKQRSVRNSELTDLLIKRSLQRQRREMFIGLDGVCYPRAVCNWMYGNACGSVPRPVGSVFSQIVYSGSTLPTGRGTDPYTDVQFALAP